MWSLDTITHWHWWILAVLLLALEALLPGAIFLWLGVASILTGMLAAIWPSIGWQWQFISFALLAVASIALWRSYQRRYPDTSARHSLLNQRGRQYVGRTFNLREPIVNGTGKIKVDDSTWKVRGPDCPIGTAVVVTGVDGVVLEVETKAPM
jgi:inner membrane protein